jgi:hypothetical protein
MAMNWTTFLQALRGEPGHHLSPHSCRFPVSGRSYTLLRQLQRFLVQQNLQSVLGLCLLRASDARLD